jgi:hypothetical protein
MAIRIWICNPNWNIVDTQKLYFKFMEIKIQTMGIGKLDLVKECRILECPIWPQGISNLFKIVNEKNRYKNISFKV